VTPMTSNNPNTIASVNNAHSNVGVKQPLPGLNYNFGNDKNEVMKQNQVLNDTSELVNTENRGLSEGKLMGSRALLAFDNDYVNGKLKEDKRVNYENYYTYGETFPERYHPLVQFLDDTELKFYNDNLFYNTPYGFPTRASLLKEKVYRLPLLKDTPAEKARYKRKVEETQKIIASARKKFDFRTADGSTSHYFLTGARFNRNDTIDSKILSNYGIFINKNNPELCYFKNNIDPDVPGSLDRTKRFSSKLRKASARSSSKKNNYIDHIDKPILKSKSIQVPQLSKGET